MRNRGWWLALLAGALLVAGGAVQAASASLSGYAKHAVVVLVTVNPQGKITELQPAYEVPRDLRATLRATLEEMITGPAHGSHGRPVASQVIVQLGLDAKARDDGDYDVHFTFLQALPVPYGSWFWNHLNGRKLALQSNDGARFGVPLQRFQPPWPRPRPIPRRRAMPSMQAPPPARPVPAPRTSH